MKYLLILVVGVCLLLASVPATADQAGDEAAIRKVMEKRIAADNAKDAKAFATLHIESFENWDGSVKGRDAFEKSLAKRYERLGEDYRRKLLGEIGIVFVTPEVAIFKGHEEFTGWKNAEGKKLPPIKRLVARVLVKKDGMWLVAATFGRSIDE